MKPSISIQDKINNYQKFSSSHLKDHLICNNVKVIAGLSFAGILPLLVPSISFGQGGCGGTNGVQEAAGAYGPLLDVNNNTHTPDDFSFYVVNVSNVFLKKLGTFSVATSDSNMNTLEGYPEVAKLASGVSVYNNLNWNAVGKNNYFALVRVGVANFKVGDTGFIGIRKSAAGGGHNYGYIKVSITAPTFDETDILDAETGLSTGTGAVTTGDCSSLPVEITVFIANVRQNQASLNWKTASEINNAGFEVQRSTDGKSFRTLSFVEGAGTSYDMQEYYYDDKDLRTGQLYYYRLKQIDYNGKFEYSSIVTAKIEGNKISGVFSPNPSSDGRMVLDYTSVSEGKVHLQVFDVAGKELLQQTHGVTDGSNKVDLDFSHLGKGMFFVKMQQDSHAVYEKIVIE